MAEDAVPIYQSYLIRCWHIAPAAAETPVAWRFELREVSAEFQKHRFSDLEQIKAFISAKLTTAAESDREGNIKENNQNGGESFQRN